MATHPLGQNKLRIWRTFGRKTIFLLLCFLGASALQAQPQFSITNLNRLLPASGYPNGFENGNALGIGESGQVVGTGQYSSGLSPFFPFLYQGGTMTQLSPEGGFDGASAISGNGTHIVGDIGSVASRYAGAGAWTPLGDLGSSTFVYGVNNTGTGVGEAYVDALEEFHAVQYAGGTAHDLGTLGGSHSVANGINNLGQIVGHSGTGDGGSVAFIYQGGMMVGLETLNASDPSYYANAYSINEQGNIVGYAEAEDYYKHAVRWIDGEIEDLGVLAGFDESEARDINNLGQIVGTLDGYSGAFYYDGTTMWNLADLIVDLEGSGIFSLRGAMGINDLGQIVGTGYDEDGDQVAFVLDVVPEPSTWALVGLGLVAVGFAAKRKQLRA